MCVVSQHLSLWVVWNGLARPHLLRPGDPRHPQSVAATLCAGVVLAELSVLLKSFFPVTHPRALRGLTSREAALSNLYFWDITMVGFGEGGPS